MDTNMYKIQIKLLCSPPQKKKTAQSFEKKSLKESLKGIFVKALVLKNPRPD